MMKKILLLASLISISYAGSALAIGNAAAGKAKSVTCAACHGPDGNSVAPNFPKLAGQNASYIVKELMNFKSRKRLDPTMNAMAAPLSEQDMEDLAAYFSSQKTSPGTAAKDKVELGEMIYRSGNVSTGVAACAACHGPTGSGNAQAKFPRLAGQHAPYVVAQLNKFTKGERANDPGSMMRVVAHKMSEAEIQAVAQYIQGLK